VHDVSLGTTITDYLTGEELDATTYEDLRQAMARLLVEEKGFPKDRLTPRVAVTVPIEGRDYSRLLDLVAFDDAGMPLMALLFCPGVVTTYHREALASARLLAPRPAPLIVVTDTKDAIVLETGGGTQLGEGLLAVPDWPRLQQLVQEHPAVELTEEQRERESRILYAYSEALYDCCGGAACAIANKGGRFGKGP